MSCDVICVLHEYTCTGIAIRTRVLWVRAILYCETKSPDGYYNTGRWCFSAFLNFKILIFFFFKKQILIWLSTGDRGFWRPNFNYPEFYPLCDIFKIRWAIFRNINLGTGKSKQAKKLLLCQICNFIILKKDVFSACFARKTSNFQ